MQQNNFSLQNIQISCLPMISQIIDRLDLKNKLSVAFKNIDYAETLIILLKNILIDREALYALKSWAIKYELKLSSGSEISDDRVGRTLDRLYEIDRSTLQTQITLSLVKNFNIKMDQIHSDTTSVAVSGCFNKQTDSAIQLKRGYSKDHRPDLKQLVYSLCISSDGAVPIHFKTYDGNRSDDSIQWETWNSLRTLLQRPNFIYVGDSKLCVEETLKKIDQNHGLFVTVVPRNRTEVKEFSNSISNGDIRWEKILRKRSRRNELEFDTYETAIGPSQLREGYTLYWYRSSQKKKRDEKDRKDRISRAIEKLENLNLIKIRGPKTEGALQKRIDAILERYKVQEFLSVKIQFDLVEKFTAISRGKPTDKTHYKRKTTKVPRLIVKKNTELIVRAQFMDGIFPLTTNTKEKALSVLQIYKYQPMIEKRHAFLKSTLNVAPIWLKKNSRIEALMFVEFLAQMVAATLERELRLAMENEKIKAIKSLPENRESQTPTFEQILRIFENFQRHNLFEDKIFVKSFSDPLSPVQNQILNLLKTPKENFI